MKSKILFFATCIVATVGLLTVSCSKKDDFSSIYGYSIGSGDLRYLPSKDCIINSKNGKVLYKDVDWVHDDGDSIGIVAINDKRAYVNLNTGKALTNFDYDKAWIFSCNRGVMVKGDSILIFRRDGSIVNSQKLKYRHEYELVFYSNLLVVSNDSDFYGVVDTTSNWILKPEYNFVDINYHNKLFSTRKDDIRAVYTFDFKPVLSGNFSEINILYDEGIIATEHNGIDHLFSYDGKLLYDVIFKNISELEYKSKDKDGNHISTPTNCYVYTAYNGKCGLMNRQYKALTPPLFYDIEAKTAHIFFATFEYRSFGVLLDETGKQINN